MIALDIEQKLESKEFLSIFWNENIKSTINQIFSQHQREQEINNNIRVFLISEVYYLINLALSLDAICSMKFDIDEKYYQSFSKFSNVDYATVIKESLSIIQQIENFTYNMSKNNKKSFWALNIPEDKFSHLPNKYNLLWINMLKVENRKTSSANETEVRISKNAQNFLVLKSIFRDEEYSNIAIIAPYSWLEVRHSNKSNSTYLKLIQ